MSGNAVTNNCDSNADGNAGCGVQATAPNSYGKSFNGAGGGFYAMERTTSFIKVWFWPRNSASVPSSVTSGSSSLARGARCPWTGSARIHA